MDFENSYRRARAILESSTERAPASFAEAVTVKAAALKMKRPACYVNDCVSCPYARANGSC